jgi:hypothetical protein
LLDFLVDDRAAYFQAALLGGTLAAERRCPPLKAEPRQAQQGLRRPRCAGVRGREASYTGFAGESQSTRKGLGQDACVTIELSQGVQLAELSQRVHSTTGWKEGNS